MLLRVFDPGRLSASKGVGSDLAYGVTGDIRAIGGNGFKALGSSVSHQPSKVAQAQVISVSTHISEVPSFMLALHLLLQRTSTLIFKDYLWQERLCWSLSEDSPLIGMMVR